MVKRVVDLLGAAVALAVLAPLLLAVAVAILLLDGPPVLFRQVRVGREGAPFAMLKFRTMVRDAEARGPYHTATDDPRITPWGAFLRRTSIDELPQLVNVLRGEMSLVGPRPDVPAQRQEYTAAEWAKRCSVRPGLTGLAQARIRSVGTPQERLALDLAYVDACRGVGGLLLDFKVMWWTLGRLSGKGAN